MGSVFLLAIGLSMDAMAVAAARGLAAPVLRAKHVWLVALLFGGFQALMPALGHLLGTSVGDVVAAYDHWIAFVLLGGIGGKMLWEARGGDDDDDAPRPGATEADLFGLRVMFILAIATSIDAFAAGITLPLLAVPVPVSLAIIGLTTAVLSALGLFAGRRFGAHLGPRLDVLGGVVLIGLGAKILYEHTLEA
ncbi:manganese efflux pump MntP family protein [Myxococcota bacterium]|nr:manganese efflux pump MntP family protein [Myxococcota bacterium]